MPVFRIGPGSEDAPASDPLVVSISLHTPHPSTFSPPVTPVDKGDVNFEELARSTDDFNGAMLKVCVGAHMCVRRVESMPLPWGTKSARES